MKEKALRIIKIDPLNRTVTEEILDISEGSKLQLMYKIINTDIVEGHTMPDGKSQLIVDEEAKMKKPQPGFHLSGIPSMSHHQFVGVGVIVGLKRGDWVSTEHLAEEILPLITWA